MSGGYNRGGYPPPQPHYSPPYGDNSNATGYRPPMPPAGFPPFPPRNFPTPPIPPTTPAYRSPYEEYGSSSSASFLPKHTPYTQQRNQDAYDPYQPAAYDPGAPQLRSGQTVSYTPPASATQPQHRLPARPGEAHDLPLLTSPTTATVGNYTGAVYSLPQSHLPITKYVTVNPGDAIDLHRAICQTGMTQAIWYSDGQVRAGEGWGAAVEWVLETGVSGAKLRTCVGQTDSLGTELGAIIKAVEGFRDHLNKSIKTQKAMSHEFVLFTSSAAAIVSLDTSSRPESLQFCRLWREICTDFLTAHLTLVHLPKGSDVEGFELAQKIANVAASNSYTKRKKDRVLDDYYNRPGGGEPSPGGSTEAGPWQRGDADPSRRKSPFDRPKPLPMSPELSPQLPADHEEGELPRRSISPPPRRPSSGARDVDLPPHSADPRPEEEDIQPREDALFVTHFPDQACAKDLGILFAQFGDILSVDIFSLPPVKPRFAFVAYAEKPDCAKAIEKLHQRPIDLDTPFARENAEDLEIWKGWNGALTVVESDGERLVPLNIAKDFPDLPHYATQRRQVPPTTVPSKREHGEVDEAADNSAADSPSSKKARRDSDAKGANSTLPSIPSSLPPRPHGLPPRPASSFDPPDRGVATPTPPPANGTGSLTHPLPPTPLTVRDGKSPSIHSPMSEPSASAGVPSRVPLTASNDGSVVKISGKTLQAQIDLVQNVFVKHDRDNWIAHTCLIATDLDQVRRQLQADLYATDEASLTAKDLEDKLVARGFTVARMDAFVSKVLKVLDGIAAEDEAENGGSATKAETEADLSTTALETELAHVLRDYPTETRDAMSAAAKVLEYLHRGKDKQEAKRLEVERRAGVLEGMVAKGEQVTGVVRFLLAGS